MEISAWDIYWVMQLDNIGVSAGLVTFLGIAVLAFAYFGAFVEECLPKWLPVLLTPFWLLAALTSVFLPSSKTAAAMIVLPAIANNKSIQAEAGDIYKLAKDALRKVGANESQGESDE